MSIIPGKPYRIMNKQAGLALDLSKKDPRQDGRPILGEYVKPGPRQTWTVERAGPEGSYYIKSDEEDDLYIGFEGEEVVRAKLIGVDRDRAKAWNIKQTGPLNYLIGLKGYPFVMEFPKDNLHPGTQAQLGVLFLEETNQIWVINELN